MFILLLARLLNTCVLLLVQLFYDPFSEADSHTRAEVNIELNFFFNKVLSFVKCCFIGTKMVCGNTPVLTDMCVGMYLRSLHLIWSFEHHR